LVLPFIIAIPVPPLAVRHPIP